MLFALCLGAPWSGAARAQSPADAAIQATVTAWAQAWSAKDVERYLGFYAPAFKPPGGLTRQAWEKQRRARVTGPSVIEVSASDLKILRRDDASAAVSFHQRYRSNVYQDETSKTLELVRDGDRWLIAEEKTGPQAAQAAAAAAPAPAAEAGVSTALGRLRVHSALGQPLRAEVEVSPAQRGEQGVTAARLASPDTYQRAGVEFSPALGGVNVSIERRDGGPFIALTTHHPVNEPYLRLLIELESKSGRLVRDYTALLDPPSRVAPAPPVATPAPVAPSAAAPRAPVAPVAPPAAPAAPSKAPAAMAPPTRIAQGRIRPQDGTAPRDPSKARVKLAGAEAAKPGVATEAGADDRVAQERAMKEAQSRIAELQKTADDLTKLIEIRNLQIAELERRTAQARPAPVPAPAPAPAPAAKPAAEAPKPAAEAPKAAVQAPKPAIEAPKPAIEAPKPAVVAKPAPEAKPAAKPRPAPPPPAPEPSLFDEYLGDPVMLGGLGVVAVLLAGYGAYAWRRKKQAALARLDESQQILAAGGAALEVDSTPGAKGVTATQPSVEDVDALAEADVYMAYGRDAQAEELLREALEKGANRPVVHLKLLQIYAKRRDTGQFESEARKLRGLVNGEGPEWDKAVALGRSIDPGNALYGDAKAVATPAEELTPEAPAVDFDLNAIEGPGPAQAAAPETLQPSTTSVLDFDLGGSTGELPVARATPPAARPAAPDPSVDLSTISLNLDEPEPAGAGAAPSNAKLQEVAVKIDIAKAYAEIGDNDGAKELLKEILTEGDAAQQAQARQMLASLE